MVVRHGSNPRRAPRGRCVSIHVSGRVMDKGTTVKAVSSTCAGAWRVYRPSTKSAASVGSTTQVPAEPVKPVR